MLFNITKISFLDGLGTSAVCILVVFAVLIILALFINLIQYFNPKKKEATEAAQLEKREEVTYKKIVRKYISLEDIKDDDMMAAAIVATIDYHDETHEDVRVISIRQIG